MDYIDPSENTRLMLEELNKHIQFVAVYPQVLEFRSQGCNANCPGQTLTILI
jgi:hypothetical protein